MANIESKFSEGTFLSGITHIFTFDFKKWKLIHCEEADEII
jgi:hypothetical protein